jgi:hypothetical protein
MFLPFPQMLSASRRLGDTRHFTGTFFLFHTGGGYQSLLNSPRINLFGHVAENRFIKTVAMITSAFSLNTAKIVLYSELKNKSGFEASARR